MEKDNKEKARVEALRYTVKPEYKGYPPSVNIECKIVTGPRKNEIIWFNGPVRSEGQRSRVIKALAALGGEPTVKYPVGLGKLRALAVLGTTKAGKPCIDYLNTLKTPDPSSQGACELVQSDAVDVLDALLSGDDTPTEKGY